MNITKNIIGNVSLKDTAKIITINSAILIGLYIITIIFTTLLTGFGELPGIIRLLRPSANYYDAIPQWIILINLIIFFLSGFIMRPSNSILVDLISVLICPLIIIILGAFSFNFVFLIIHPFITFLDYNLISLIPNALFCLIPSFFIWAGMEAKRGRKFLLLLVALLILIGLLYIILMGNNVKIFEAVDRDDVDRLGRLIKNEEQVNIRDRDGNTPLIRSCSTPGWLNDESDIATAEFLIEHGANVNASNNERETALSVAVENGNKDMIRLLINNGADISPDKNMGLTPLMIYSSTGNYSEVEKLVNTGDINEQDSKGKTALDYALINKEKNIAFFLIENGAKTKNDSDEAADFLNWAAAEGDLETIKYLAEGGINLSSKDYRGKTPLMFSTENCHYEVVKYLIENGADINASNTSFEKYNAIKISLDNAGIMSQELKWDGKTSYSKEALDITILLIKENAALDDQDLLVIKEIYDALFYAVGYEEYYNEFDKICTDLNIEHL